jgi:hypothetical protein
LSLNTAFCSHASRKREKFLEIETLDPTFKFFKKEIFGRKVKSYVENPSLVFLKEIKRTTLKTIAFIKLILPKMK